MDETAVLLSRFQFAFTIGFHYLFPPLTIGLGLLMVIMEGLFLWKKDHQYEAMAKFWTRIFALIFAMGVATGIVMEFQFGTNWSAYSRYVGDVFGSALAAEGIFAFFLESGFLAILVFGWDKVRPPMHFFSTLMVSLGSIFSAIWIIVANSWQQTPAGHHIVTLDGVTRAEIVDFWQVVFNPSTVERLTHTLIGAFIAGGFLVLSVSAYYLLRNRHQDFARRSIAIALPFSAFFSIMALVSGHANANMVAREQPSKLAALEGHFTTTDGGAPLYLFGIPNVAERRVDYGLAIPGMLSFLVHGDLNAPIPALDNPAIVPGGLPAGERVEDYWPPIHITFHSYHLMVALGMFFIFLTLYALLQWWRGKLFTQRWLLWIFVYGIAGPLIANQVGWIAAEVGRQPWIVWGLLKTRDGVSPTVSALDVGISIVLFGLIYLLLLAVWLFVLDSKIRHGPDDPEQLAREFRARRGWIFAAADVRADPATSLTDAHGPPPDERREESR